MCVEVGCLCPYEEGPFGHRMALQPCLTLLSPSHRPPPPSSPLPRILRGRKLHPFLLVSLLLAVHIQRRERGSDVLPRANRGLWNLIRPTSQQEKVCRMLFRNGQTLQGMSSIINQACQRPLPPPRHPPPHPLTPPPPSLLLSAVGEIPCPWTRRIGSFHSEVSDLSGVTISIWCYVTLTQ